MLFFGLIIDENVINEYHDEGVNALKENSLHEVDKCIRFISEKK